MLLFCSIKSILQLFMESPPIGCIVPSFANLLFNFSLLFINLQALALNILFPIVSLTITSSPLSQWFLSPSLLFFLSLMMVLFLILASREQWKRKCMLYILFLSLLVLQLLVVSRYHKAQPWWYGYIECLFPC